MSRLVFTVLLAAFGLAVALAPAPAAPKADEVKITWKKTVFGNIVLDTIVNLRHQ